MNNKASRTLTLFKFVDYGVMNCLSDLKEYTDQGLDRMSCSLISQLYYTNGNYTPNHLKYRTYPLGLTEDEIKFCIQMMRQILLELGYTVEFNDQLHVGWTTIIVQ